MTEECPYCGERVEIGFGEVEHMNERHPEIIVGRLLKAGFRKDPDSGEWVDTLTDGRDG